MRTRQPKPPMRHRREMWFKKIIALAHFLGLGPTCRLGSVNAWGPMMCLVVIASPPASTISSPQVMPSLRPGSRPWFPTKATSFNMVQPGSTYEIPYGSWSKNASGWSSGLVPPHFLIHWDPTAPAAAAGRTAQPPGRRHPRWRRTSAGIRGHFRRSGNRAKKK